MAIERYAMMLLLSELSIMLNKRENMSKYNQSKGIQLFGNKSVLCFATVLFRSNCAFSSHHFICSIICIYRVYVGEESLAAFTLSEFGRYTAIPS